jgi:hypothetical protein
MEKNMNDISNLKKSLPEMEHSFTIQVEGMLTRLPFDGNFTCKIPNAKTQAAIGKHKAMLNGGFSSELDLGTRNLHHMISYLRYTLTDMPKWWKDADLGYDLYDVNVIEEIYSKVLQFEKAWYESVWGKPEEEKPNE